MFRTIAYYLGKALIVLGALMYVGPLVGGFASPGDVGGGWAELMIVAGHANHCRGSGYRWSDCKSRRRRRRVGGTYDRSRPANHCRGSGYRWSDCKCAAAANEIEKSGVLVRACIPTIFLDSYSRERPTDHSDRNLGGLDTNNCSYGLLLLETRRSISLSDIFGRSRDYHAIRYVFYVCDKINKMEIVTNLKFYQ